MKRSKSGSTPRQYAYAVKKLGGQGRSKKDIALSVNFSPSVAANAANKIETTAGYLNAVIGLATESNNLVLAIMTEYKARGFKNFSNKDLSGALNAISGAWERFDKKRAPDQNRTPEGNPLRKVIMQKVENQVINVTAEPAPASTPEPAPISSPDENGDDPMDF
jgi:hypothetical protein